MDGEDLGRDMTAGEGPSVCYLNSDCESVRVDDTFYGLTPLNAVAGTPKAEYGISSFHRLKCKTSSKSFSFIAITGLAGRAFGSW